MKPFQKVKTQISLCSSQLSTLIVIGSLKIMRSVSLKMSKYHYCDNLYYFNLILKLPFKGPVALMCRVVCVFDTTMNDHLISSLRLLCSLIFKLSCREIKIEHIMFWANIFNFWDRIDKTLYYICLSQCHCYYNLEMRIEKNVWI